MAEFLMPILGADMEAGTLIEWRKRPGDHVERGEIIAEVETDKGLIEVEIFVSGVVEKILVHPGEKVPVGTVLALIREEGEPQREGIPSLAGAPVVAPPGGAVTALPAAPPGAEPLRREPSESTAPSGVSLERLRVSPAARRLATERGVDLTAIRGTGPSGAILREDVERAIAERTSAPAGRADKARMRHLIGAAMARSKREIPHYYLATTIDMQHATTWLAETNLARAMPERMLYGVLLVRAVALALRETPELNAVWMGDEAQARPAINVGVAIALRDGGLIAPALHDADRRSLDDLWRGFRDLVKRARSGGLRSSELSDSTITVTSLGEQGVEIVFPIIYPPQVAIVGFGKLVERPWSVDGRVVSRPVVTATLSADHRVTDGHRGGRFLAAVDRLLQEPERL